jgi:hypothetical protein
VLVQGAWVDSSGWKPVYTILTKDGYNVKMVQLPETSFRDDVAATKRVLYRPFLSKSGSGRLLVRFRLRSRPGPAAGLRPDAAQRFGSGPD